ncbi:MAG: isochorismatase family protein [Acholeplasmataceae bacterium]|nr:isochorismatase family protein [Acholeplasmataceae bacterium]
MNVAFLIVDVQKEYVEEPMFKDQLKTAAMYINEVSGYFRNAKRPVIHIQHATAGDGKGTEGFKVADEIIQKDSDIYMTKAYGNGFWKTNLEETLKSFDVDYVIISGLSASSCVLATLNGATERGFKASLLQHGLLGNSLESVKLIENERNLISFSAIKYILDLLNQ